MLNNAIKFTDNRLRPDIQIDFEDTGATVKVSVKDNGIGIAKKDQKKIFELFKRLNNKEQYPGTGIGLALAKKIAIIHHGGISLESRVGKGSTFYVELSKKWVYDEDESNIS